MVHVFDLFYGGHLFQYVLSHIGAFAHLNRFVVVSSHFNVVLPELFPELISSCVGCHFFDLKNYCHSSPDLLVTNTYPEYQNSCNVYADDVNKGEAKTDCSQTGQFHRTVFGEVVCVS